LDDGYVYVGKSTGIYDAPSANNPTINQFDEPVAVEKGMAFKKTGETKLYYKVVFQDMEKYISKSACTTPDPLGSIGGVYNMRYPDESTYPISVLSTDQNDIYNVVFKELSYASEKLAGTRINPSLIIITVPAWDNKVVGTATRINGNLYFWIYDDMLLGWS